FRRPHPGDERQSRLWRAEIHRLAARQDPRPAAPHRHERPPHRPRGRWRHHRRDGAARARSRCRCPRRGHRHLQRRRRGLRRQYRASARQRRGARGRLMPLSQSVLYGSAVYHLSLWGRAPSNLAIRLGETWPGDAARGHALLSGSFDFAGEAARAAAPPWTAAHRVEWLAAMHGYSWLADIAAIGGEMPWQRAREWTADWLARCDAWEETAWRADVVGDRLVAWIEHFDALVMRAGDDGFRQRLLASFARQSRHLARVATHAAPGMPRLAALRGLVAAAAALADERRLRNALTKLGRECEAQLLPDGCHVERSPAAQVRALRYLIDARAALRALQFEVPPALQQAIDRAAPI